MKLSLFGHVLIVRAALIKRPGLSVKGLTSRCKDGKHVLLLDYDGVAPERVDEDIKNLSPHCSHFFVFKTKETTDALGKYGNYHVICTDKFDFGKIVELQGMTHTDAKHKKMINNTRYRAWVLRVTPKGRRGAPEFVKFVKGTKSTFSTEQSSGHLHFINIYHEEALKRKLAYTSFNGDGCFEVTLTDYHTSSEDKED